MELLTSIVDLDSIKVNSLPFAIEGKNTQIEALANSIINLNGLINIPIVKQIGMSNYELLSGHLEFYAYCRACELNSHLPDRMSVFIIDNKKEEAIRKQLEILRMVESSLAGSPKDKTSRDSEIELQIQNLEASLKTNERYFASALDKARLNLLSLIETKSPKPIAPLNSFNEILEPPVAFQVQSKLEKQLGLTKATKVVRQLQDYKKNRSNQAFKSFTEVLTVLKTKQGSKFVRLVSEEKMLDIIDSFQHISPDRSTRNPQASFSQTFSDANNPLATLVLVGLEPVFSAVETRLLQPVSPLEAFNRISEPNIKTLVQRKLEFLGISKAEKIVARLQEVSKSKHQPFHGFSEVVGLLKIKKEGRSLGLISKEKMLAVLDRWNS